MFIVIPCYKEENLIKTLASLHGCNKPEGKVKVLVVINHSRKDDEEIIKVNNATYKNTIEWIRANDSDFINVKILNEALPEKDAGVGLARKIGMDIAAETLITENNPKGVIVCLDADCAVKENYLVEIEKHFKKFPLTPACSIYFEHPLEGDQPSEIYKAILDYELHLRYYVNVLRFAGHPFAYQTIGSSMAVRADVYVKQGGMNKRKAGEDFYFLQKIIPLGNFTEINTTTVIPSPRVSDRVPFGTGKAVGDFLKRYVQESYNLNTFKDLKIFIGKVNDFYLKGYEHVNSIPESVRVFIETQQFKEKLQEIRSNTSNYETFRNRFFRWFNAFLALKYVHFARDYYYPNQTVQQVVEQYFSEILQFKQPLTVKEMLFELRKNDKNVK